MTNRVFLMINRFFEGTGSVISTPSGDARGHLNRDFMLNDQSTDETSEWVR
jgi:hypothetical protein